MCRHTQMDIIISILLIQADAALSDQPLLQNKTLLVSHPPVSLLPSHPLRNYRFALRQPGNSLSLYPPTQTHTFISNDHKCKLGNTHALTLFSLYLLRPLEGAPILRVSSVLCCLWTARVCFSKIQFISPISITKPHFVHFCLTFGCKCGIKPATIQQLANAEVVVFIKWLLKVDSISQLKCINYPAQII